MPHQQPLQRTKHYSPNQTYTITDDVPSSSDDDDDDIDNRESRNGNFSSAVEGSVASRGSGLMPGDSFPATAHQLQATSMGDDIDDDDFEGSNKNKVDFDDGMEEFVSNGGNETTDTEQELLRRLSQGQARMEQIKRMLVNQRGFIVESLKQLAVSNIVGGDRHQNGRREEENITNGGDCFSDKHPCANCQHNIYSNTKDISFEQDRTLGRSVAITDFTAATSNTQRINHSSNMPIGTLTNFIDTSNNTSENTPQKENIAEAHASNNSDVVAVTNRHNDHDAAESTTTSSTSAATLYNGMRLCPMCEAAFPPNSVSQEDFELHVVEHFNFDEAETLRYIPPSSSSSSNADYSSGGGGMIQ